MLNGQNTSAQAKAVRSGNSVSSQRNGDVRQSIYGTNCLSLKIFLLVIGYIFMTFFRNVMIPTDRSAQCFRDSVHESKLFASFNSYINQHEELAFYLTLFYQYALDFFIIAPITIWILKGNSYSRWILPATAFYLLRALHTNLFQFKFPEGYYWKDTKWFSIMTPYQNSQAIDFFFSSHCGALTLAACELQRQGYKLLARLNVLALVLMSAILLALRAHYWIDISAGVIISHYLYIIIEPYSQKIDRVLAGFIRRQQYPKKIEYKKNK